METGAPVVGDGVLTSSPRSSGRPVWAPPPTCGPCCAGTPGRPRSRAGRSFRLT